MWLVGTSSTLCWMHDALRLEADAMARVGIEGRLLRGGEVSALVRSPFWTVGVGGEYAFLDWLTGFVEYDFYDFGTRTNTFATCTVAACGAVTFPVDIKEHKNVFKVGLNFKFGPTAPLVGRY